MNAKKHDKLGLLASLRRQATGSEGAPSPTIEIHPAIHSSVAPVVAAAGQAWLERTSITLKAPDREALRTLTLFLVQQGRQHVQTSTVIQAALQFSAAHLVTEKDEFLGTFERVRNADRRKGP
jgi:hypothetical protein